MIPWIEEAEKHIGLSEIKGSMHNAKIVEWLIKLKAWWRDDETPWCGVFVAHCIKTAGYDLPKHWYRAKDWLNWGVKVSTPLYGCVVIFERQSGGHVGFVVGKDKKGRLMVLGGNQGDKVSIAPFDPARVSGYRMPVGYKYNLAALPLIDSSATSSSNEA